MPADASLSRPDVAARPAADADPVRARLGAALAAGDPLRALIAGLDWVVPIGCRAAPGFVYLAGAAGGIGLGGGGADLAGAATRLAGEAAEVAAQRAPPVPSAAPGLPALDALWVAAHPGPRIAATELATGAAVGVPAAAVHLDPTLDARLRPGAPPRSLGLAAGPDRAAARLAALFELVERDAAAAWWQEGLRPHALDVVAAAPAAALLARLRAGAPAPRLTLILELPAAVPVAVVAAASLDADGRGLAVGLKAAQTPEAAAEGAIIELLQMEIALEMARDRAARGSPTAGDRRHLARADIALAELAAFAPLPPRALAGPGIADLDGLVAALAARGLGAIVADLPAAAGLAVAKAFVPGLRPLPGGATARGGTLGSLAGLM